MIGFVPVGGGCVIALDKQKKALDREMKSYGLQLTDEESASLFPLCTSSDDDEWKSSV